MWNDNIGFVVSTDESEVVRTYLSEEAHTICIHPMWKIKQNKIHAAAENKVK